MWKHQGQDLAECQREGTVPRDNLYKPVHGSDVGPVPRQRLTRADDFFDGPFVLTLTDELARGQVPD